MEAHRFFEDHTLLRNRIASNNLNEALSHLGRLAETADRTTEDEQRAQITNFEDHLRRAMMESFELVARARMGKLQDDGVIDQFESIAVPLMRSGKLPNAKSLDEIEALEVEIARWMEEGRKRKDEITWEEWDHGAECLLKACDTANELATEMRRAVGAALEYRRHRFNIILAIGLAVAGIAGGAVVALAFAA
jgi:hypothetical protein